MQYVMAALWLLASYANSMLKQCTVAVHITKYSTAQMQGNIQPCPECASHASESCMHSKCFLHVFWEKKGMEVN